MRPGKFDAINRPLDILGVRLYFPPYEKADWSVNVRIESCGHDPTKVYLNSYADWEQHTLWDERFVDNACEKIGTVSTFMSTRLIQFLREPPISEDDVEQSDDD